MAITQTITSIAPAANPATMDRTTFSTTAAANVLAISAMTTELNTWTGQVNAIVSGTAGDMASGVNAATAKTTPVDADLLCLTDSAASFVLKKFTWANLKTTLGSTFAALAGSTSQAFSVLAATSAAHAVAASQLPATKAIPVNGCCMIDQINVGGLITPASGSYPIDGMSVGLAAASKLQTQQITTSLLTLNASHAIRFSVLAQYTAGATESFNTNFTVEGVDIADWKWGTANAAAVSLQFKARASVAGTYSGSIRNAAGNRSYPFSFVLAANTDTQIKLENIPGDVTGTWLSTNVMAARITFDMGSGANYLGTAGAWAAVNVNGVTGAAAFVAQVNGSTLDITDVLINRGTFCNAFPRRTFQEVFEACRRYLRMTYAYGTAPGTASAAGYLQAMANKTLTGGSGEHSCPWMFNMRAAPTQTYYTYTTGTAGGWEDGGGTQRAMTSTFSSSGGSIYSSAAVAANTTLFGHVLLESRM